jgi:phosphohistidine phosphatase
LKTLIFVRHAKSAWDDPSISDFDRTLNNRGNKDAPKMAEVFKDKNIMPDLIISSPATRAYTTCQYFANAIGYPETNIDIRDTIYSGGARAIVTMITQFDDKFDCIAIFGHNPDLTALANHYCGLCIDNVPTCGVVCIDFDIPSWTKVEKFGGKLRFFDTPKNNKFD